MMRAMLALCLVVAAHAAAAATHTITMDGTSFSPETLTVKRGDSVLWVNKDPFPHTATAASKAFDSKSVAPGKSWRYVANKTGTFDYVCAFHPTMKGRLVVE
jgi:plastocyanin